MVPPVVKNLIVEAFGVFALVYIGGLGVLSTTVGGSLTSVGIAHGIILGFAIVMGGPISGGQYNPAVTLALVITGDLHVAQGITYIVAQTVGSFLGATAILSVKPAMVVSKTVSLGFPQLSAGVQPMQGFIMEFTATFFLVLAVYTGVRTKQNERNIALYVGGILFCFIQAIGPYTGAALNPCRVIGPAVLSGKIGARGAWLYYPATLLGGVCAGLFSHFIIHNSTTETASEEDDKLSQELTM